MRAIVMDAPGDEIVLDEGEDGSMRFRKGKRPAAVKACEVLAPVAEVPSPKLQA